ncbi:MAG: hypothetical protein ACE5K9_07135 [Candidatus Methylomirabilales bacterium]
MYPWSASVALQEIYQSLEEQRQVLDQLKAYLDERLVPFQCHVGEHQRNVDQALRHLEGRLKPMRQYIQGEHQNLERMTFHLTGGVGEQFEAFEQFLATHSEFLEQANDYVEEQCRPLQGYLEDERQAIETIYQDLAEQKLDHLLKLFSEQQKIIESFRKSEVKSEYETLAEYLDERQKAFERYVRTADFRPAEFFAQLKEIADRYKPQDPRQDTLFAKVFEQTGLADEKFRQALSVSVPAPSRRKQPKQPQKRKSVSVVPVPLQEIEVGVDGNGSCAVAG